MPDGSLEFPTPQYAHTYNAVAALPNAMDLLVEGTSIPLTRDSLLLPSSPGRPMHYNYGLFRCNGRSGLVPKPPQLCSSHSTFSPDERLSYRPSTTTLTVSVGLVVNAFPHYKLN